MQFRVSPAEKAIARHCLLKPIEHPNLLAPNFTDRQGRGSLASDGRLNRDFHDE